MNSESISTLGLKFVVEPQGTALSDQEKRLLAQLKPSGIMFRKRNFLQGQDYSTWLSAYRQLVNDCKEAVGREKIIWCIDHEGGRVIRPPEPITRFPYAARWGKEIGAVAQAMALELRSLGINVNFAPVADIHTNPQNSVINERAFATNAKDVTASACAFATTMLKYGILPCAKHFPGNGDVRQDPHFGLATSQATLADLRGRELLPFKALINMGVPLIMTAHILFTEIDHDNQATTSKTILDQLLRKEMRFEQVIIADALGMKGIVNEISVDKIIANAVNAGLDLFLVAGDNVDLEGALAMATQMQTAVKDGLIKEEILQASLERIDKLLGKLTDHQIEAIDHKVFIEHAQLAARLAECQPWPAFELSLPGFE